MTNIQDIIEDYDKLKERVRKLEKDSFGATFEENYEKLSPREQAERITEGKDKPHHIGTKTKEVLRQEIFSLKNRWHPDTMTDAEKLEFNKDLHEVFDEIVKLPKDVQEWIMKGADDLLKANTP